MPFQTRGLRAAAVAAALFSAAPAFAASDPYGVWINDTGRGAIEIKQCGDKVCGHVVWVKDTADTEGCGRQIIGDVTSSGGGVWGGDGWIYSPERKKNYNVELTPRSDGTLKVKGYAGVKFLSRTMIWTKAPDDLVRCNAEEEVEATAPSAPTTSDSAPKAAAAEPSEPEAPAATRTRPSKQAAPAPKTSDEPKVADNERDEGTDISGLAEEFGDVFTKKDGKCKVDTPWVKLDFECGEEE